MCNSCSRARTKFRCSQGVGNHWNSEGTPWALHAKNIAIMTDAQGEEVEILVQRLVEQGTIRIDVAVVELAKLCNKRL